LTQTLEIEKVRSGDGRKGCQRVRGVVGRTERHGGMAAIGQTHDDVRALTVADRDDRQLLSAERVMRMRDRHASRRVLGREGSALAMCPPSATALLKRCFGSS
jgi:hypothetical protein